MNKIKGLSQSLKMYWLTSDKVCIVECHTSINWSYSNVNCIETKVLVHVVY